MIKLLDILENKILVPRRSKEERIKNYLIATQKKIQQYMKGGGKGDQAARLVAADRCIYLLTSEIFR